MPRTSHSRRGWRSPGDRPLRSNEYSVPGLNGCSGRRWPPGLRPIADNGDDQWPFTKGGATGAKP